MPWVKLDDHFPDHRKLAELGDYAPLCGWLYVCGLAFCNRQLTDGRIPKAHVHRLASFRHIGLETGSIGPADRPYATVGDDVTPEPLADLLVTVGLWEDQGDAYYIHDYLDYQPSKTEALALKETRAKAGMAGSAARWTAGEQSLDGKNGKPHGKPHGKPIANGMAKSCPVPVPDPQDVPPTPTETETPDLIGQFWQTWRQLLKDEAHQQIALTPRGTEYTHLVALVERYPDPDWLALIARLYVISQNTEMRKVPRSLGMLKHWAGECETLLRADGRKPASERAS